jgi:hypothetical protein
MLPIIDYIANIFQKYNNFNDYFIGEIGNSITIFQYINSCCLILYFIFLIIRFFVLKFGFKAFLMFIIKRLFVILIFSYGIYVSSDFMICDTVVNKTIKSHSSNLTDEQKKYIAIGCGLVISTYLIYKFIVKLDSYTRYNIGKEKFEQLSNFDEKTKKVFIEKNNMDILEYTEKKEEVKVLTEYIVANSSRLAINEFNTDLEALNNSLFSKYESIKRINPTLPGILNFNDKQEIATQKLNKIVEKMYILIGDTKNKPFRCNFDLLIEKKRELVMELLSLDVLYSNIITDLIHNPVVSKKYYKEIVTASLEVDRSLSAIIKSSNEIIRIIPHSTFICGIPGSPGTTLYYVGQNGFLNPPLSVLDGYLTGIRYLLLNTGYVFLYPTFFVFNTTLGVYNPLCFYKFKEAIWYFVTLKMFF